MLTSQLVTFSELVTMGWAFAMIAGYRWVLAKSKEDTPDEQHGDW